MKKIFMRWSLILGVFILPNVASAAEPLEGALNVAACNDISKADFSGIPEAPTQIQQVNYIEATDKTPAHCEVVAIVMPNVGIKIKLPANKWNGKFLQLGCGNYCGVFYYEKYCSDPLSRGYACITSDAGHVVRKEDVSWTDGQWAYNNMAAELDYGGRASHVTAVAGKVITEFFYSKAPARSYFMGCSYGGHQAMVLAQRYPWDFDGIVGGGVPNHLGKLMQQNLWAINNAFDKNLKSVYSQADIELLHKDALDRCDMDDGVKDGLIGNPGACYVDPDRLVCKAGQNTGCLTQAMADVAKKMYSGPTKSNGEKIAAGGWEPGTEKFWRRIYRSDGVGLVALAKNYFRYMGRWPDLGPDWDPATYDFDSDYKRHDVMETLYTANNPDLRRFKSTGGKFINYVGWSDMGTVPGEAIDYYETAEKTMGGHKEIREFFRMFMIPGSLHCRGGDGAENIDFLSYIEAWVEGNEAPDAMIGAHHDAKGKVTFTRPVYPYPLMAKYKGSGNPKDAANFGPVSTK
ncbi:MAG: tannase/feruloyl esterase family alpha/beta hydrolase [Emcibacter sp.]|nr:tannase/feruloyl esterase family alpha/beta hydrolase [Emcibacter sp.]